jgi:phosphopantetheine adenylyltransferase
MPKSLPSLLLLPPPPTSITPESLSAAYRPSITATVSALKGLSHSTKLLVVVPCPSVVHIRLREPRSQVYDEAQRLLGGLYSLICVVCAKLGVEVDSDTPGSVDARIILLDYSSSQHYFTNNELVFDSTLAGPIIDLPSLALTRRQWNLIFSVDGEEGQKLLANYQTLASLHSPPVIGQVQIVGGGVILLQKEPIRTSPSSAVHNVVIVGGTFDHLHAGHKLLLTATALLLQPAKIGFPVQRRLIVGITGDELLKNKRYAEYLKSWKQRQEDVIDFLLSILSFTRSGADEAIQTLSFDEPVPNGRAIHTKLKDCSITIECCEIQDPFGPTITDESVTALVVSGETRSGGQEVNERRLEKGWNALEVFEVDVLNAQDNGESTSNSDDFASKISSTAIRKRRAAENVRTSSL